MTIRLIAGRECRNGPSLSEQVYGEIGDALARGEKNLILIVPEQYTLGAEGGLMETCGLDGLFDVEVMSLKRLGVRVFNETGGGCIPVVDEHGEEMLFAKSFYEVKDDLDLYGGKSNSAGFVSEMTSFIDELRQNDVTPEMIEDALGGFDDDRLLGEKLSDTLKIYKKYDEVLGEDRLDETGRAKLFCEKIAESSALDGAAVWIDGFFTFSASDFHIIEALAEKARSLTMTLIGDLDEAAPDNSIFSICRKTGETLEKIAADAGQKFRLETVKNSGISQSSGIDVLERELYSYVPRPQSFVPRDIEIYACADLWDEGEKAALRMIELVRDRGYRYKDISILVGNPAESGKTIARALEFYDIPCFVDSPAPITDHPLVEMLLSALFTIQRGWQRESLLTFAKSDFSTISSEEAMELENYSFEFGVRRSAWKKKFERIDDEGIYEMDALEESRKKLTAPLIDLEKKMRGKRTYGERVTALIEFLEELKTGETLEKLSDEAEAAGDAAARSRTNQIWNILMEMFDQIAGALGDTVCSLEEFVDIIACSAASYDIGILPENEDAVQITDLFRSRSGSKRALFVLGANEDILPSEGSRFSVLTDGERRRLSEHGIPLADDSVYRRNREDYTIYRQITGVSEFLYLSYAMNGEDGKSLRISPLIDSILRIFPKLEVKSWLSGSGDDLFWITPTAGTLNELALKKSAGRGGKTRKKDDYVEAMLREKGLALHPIDTGREKSIGKELAGEIYGKPVEGSVTRFEAYRSCPYKHFVRYGLRPYELEEYEVSPPDIGSLLHAVIESVFKAAEKENKKVSELSADKRNALVDQALKNLIPETRHNIFSSSGQYRYLSRKMTRVSRRTLEVLSRHLAGGKFAFRYSEKTFNEEMHRPELPEGIMVRGKIDRIDTYVKDGETFVKVIDYKTGTADLSPTEIYYGLSLQLIFYLKESLEICDDGSGTAQPAATFYFHIDDPVVKAKFEDKEALQKALDKKFQMKGLFLNDDRVLEALDTSGARFSDIFPKGSQNKFSAGELNELLNYTAHLIAESGAEIAGGNIEVSPWVIRNKAACEACGYRSICGIDAELDRAAFRELETISREELLQKCREVQDNE